MTPHRHRQVRRRIIVGTVSGFVATIAYDLVRLVLVKLGGLNMSPFEAWRLFGIGLVGDGTAQAIIMIAGTTFHLCNGIAFGIAFTVAFGQSGPWAGILWALVLECIRGCLLGS